MAIGAAAAMAGTAGANLAGQVITNLVNVNQAKKERMHQQRLAEYSYSKDLEMWEKQNEYNKPKNQMARLSDAGLNPNLVYGDKTVSGNTSSQLPKYQRYETPYASVSMESIIPMLNQFQDLKQRQAQTDFVKEQVRGKQIENFYLSDFLGDRNLMKTMETGKQRHLLGFDRVDANDPQHFIRSSPFLKDYQSNIKRKELDNTMKSLEINLLKQGVSKSDNILLRMFIQNGLFDSLKSYMQKKY